MPDPILVEVTRGKAVESVHRGAIAIADPAGRLVFAVGEYDRPVYPRSAMKALQAIPLVASGAADHFGFGNAELALACSSHNGEAAHVNTAAAMLAAAGCDVSALECGAHWPKRDADIAALHRAGETPDALFNNCSGKHAGFVCLAHHLGVDHHGYCNPDHPVQREVMAVLTSLTETLIEPENAGIDGCSAPNWPIPLDALAMAFARFGTGLSIDRDRAKAAERLLAACVAEPFMVAGTDRFCTQVMTTLGARAFVKTGA
ncbi:MAG: asparaginase, partial [Hyphomicrobiales bacterium]|nr:asparaginase [Hyphomicrobiales bacterium]